MENGEWKMENAAKNEELGVRNEELKMKNLLQIRSEEWEIENGEPLARVQARSVC